MNQTISCQFIGHCTTLLRAGTTTIITDPHLGKRVWFSTRRHELPIDPGKLGDLSCVLLSHTHADHLDISSYKYISCSVPIIGPWGCERHIGKYLSNPVIELTPYAEHELVDGTRITAVPVVHRSCRLRGKQEGRNNAYLIRPSGLDATIFFCADSAYGPHFREIGNLGRIELALLPIGGYEPGWYMRGKHMTPAEAVTAFEDLGAQHMIPIHHSTFRLSMENIEAPMNWLQKILEERPDLTERIHPLEPGQSLDCPLATQESQGQVA